MNCSTPDPVQLDLFLHTRDVVLANDVIVALLALDAHCAARCLGRLCAEEPQHRLREALEVLCHALASRPLPSASPAEIDLAIRRLEAEVHPAALAAMGDKAAQFTRQLWRELAQSSGALAFDAAFPGSYGAALYLRCGDAEAALRAAQAVAQHQDNADALAWLALARYRMDGLDACRNPLLRLALLAPERLPGVLLEIDDPLLSRDWNAFQAECHWLDPDDPTAGTWFPAWHLIRHPAIRIDCGDPESLPATQAAKAAADIARLLELERHGYSAGLVLARSGLRSLDAGLFELYMASRNAGSP